MFLKLLVSNFIDQFYSRTIMWLWYWISRCMIPIRLCCQREKSNCSAGIWKIMINDKYMPRKSLEGIKTLLTWNTWTMGFTGPCIFSIKWWVSTILQPFEYNHLSGPGALPLIGSSSQTVPRIVWLLDGGGAKKNNCRVSYSSYEFKLLRIQGLFNEQWKVCRWEIVVWKIFK